MGFSDFRFCQYLPYEDDSIGITNPQKLMFASTCLPVAHFQDLQQRFGFASVCTDKKREPTSTLFELLGGAPSAHCCAIHSEPKHDVTSHVITGYIVIENGGLTQEIPEEWNWVHGCE